MVGNLTKFRGTIGLAVSTSVRRPSINGNYTDAASGQTFDSVNPGTGKLLARVASGDAEDINRA